MKRSMHRLLLAATSVVALFAASRLDPAQTPAPPKGQQNPKNLPTVSMAFRNALDMPVVVQGHSIINGMQRRGQPILVNPDKVGFDNNVPAGVRFITVFDGNQPSRVLALNVQVPVQPGRDIAVVIRLSPKGDRIVIAPDMQQP